MLNCSFLVVNMLFSCQLGREVPSTPAVSWNRSQKLDPALRGKPLREIGTGMIREGKEKSRLHIFYRVCRVPSYATGCRPQAAEFSRQAEYFQR